MDLKRSLFAGIFLVLFGSQVNAATVTVYGDDLKFTYDDSTMYGTAHVVGNNIFWLPTDFKASATDGAAQITSETLEVLVEVTTVGYDLSSFGLFEEGDYQLNGVGASASATGSFSVESNTSVNSESVLLDAGPLTTQGSLTDWEINALISPAWGGDTSVTVTLMNDLSASTSAVGETAFVQKKIGAVGVIANPVPVPAAAWLFGSALVGMAGLRRRKSA